MLSLACLQQKSVPLYMFPKIEERKFNFFPEIKETYMLSSMRNVYE